MALSVPTFSFGGGAQAKTPQEAARLRQTTAALMARMSTPKDVGEGLGAIGNAFVVRALNDRASAGEVAGQAEAAKLAAGLSDGADMAELQSVLANPWAAENPGTSLVAQTLFKRNLDQSDPANQLDMQYKQAQLAALQAPKPAEAPQVETRFNPETGQDEKVQWNASTGTWDAFGGQKAPDAPLVTVNTGEGADAALNKALSTKEGEQWSAYKTAGTVSASNAQDFGVLDELSGLAPQGPISGRLAETFKGFNSAADAFQSIVKRIAPTLRAPGSGATSDIEYQGMLDSLPSLASQPAANKMILEIMKAKANLNVQRSEVITAYQAGDLSVGEARAKLNELDRTSIVTPEMRLALNGLKPADKPAGDAPEGVDSDVWAAMTPEERALWN